MKVIIISGDTASGKSTFAVESADKSAVTWSCDDLLRRAAKLYHNARGEDIIIDEVFNLDEMLKVSDWIMDNAHMFSTVYLISQHHVYANVALRRIDQHFQKSGYRNTVFHVSMVRK